MNQTYSPQSPIRFLLLSPFVVSLAACLVLMIVSLTSFGAADEVGYPSWAPAAGGFLFAVPVFFGTTAFAIAVWLRSSLAFRLQRLRLIGGFLAVTAVIAITVAYIVVINDPDSYIGKFNEQTQQYEANLTLESFLSFTLLMALFFPCGGLAVLAKVLYLDAIHTVGLSKPAGRDAIGEIMRG